MNGGEKYGFTQDLPGLVSFKLSALRCDANSCYQTALSPVHTHPVVAHPPWSLYNLIVVSVTLFVLEM